MMGHMSEHHTEHLFPASVYQHRLTQAATAARNAGLDGLIFGTGAELAYLTGSWISTHERLTALIIPTDGSEPTFILPAVDRGDLALSAIPELTVAVCGWVDGDNSHDLAVKALHLAPDKHPTIGLGSSLTADHVLPLQQRIGGSTVLVATVLKELFMRKAEEEITALRNAAAAIDRVFAAVPKLLQPGRSEQDVARDLNYLILKEGHAAVDFIIVGSAANGANPHHSYSDRILKAGDVVVVDIGGTYGPNYHSDCTRTFIVGGPEEQHNPDIAAMYNVLERAQAAAVAAVKPGVTAESIDRVARNIITEAGYGEQFIHRTGHGIGLSTHEEPFIMEGNHLTLEPGMAFSIEPGIYIEGQYGARIEDIVVVTETGCETLNNQPRSLQ